MFRLPALLTTGVLAAGLGAGALGVASAASPTPPSASSPPSGSGVASGSVRPSDTAPAVHGRHVGKRLERRVLHGEFVVRQRDAFVAIALQRGEITAVSATSITVKSNDGFARSYVVNAETILRSHGRPQAVSGLTVGERAMVRAKRSGATFTALHIARVQPHGPDKVKPYKTPPGETLPG